MILIQIPTPPTPPEPSFDPNLILANGGPPPGIVIVILASLAAAVLVLFPLMRALGRRLEGKGRADPELRGEIDRLRQRLTELEALQGRVAELEERVDFAERLLARGQEPGPRILGGSAST